MSLQIPNAIEALRWVAMEENQIAAETVRRRGPGANTVSTAAETSRSSRTEDTSSRTLGMRLERVRSEVRESH